MKREMQAAIDEAYKNPSFHAECVHRAGAVPTPEEFVAHMARRLKGTHAPCAAATSAINVRFIKRIATEIWRGFAVSAANAGYAL